ncbi:MAG: hypothetical protein GX933_03235 [Chloroflexi bacterium]|nr:hypothetical protein [Chloroflexota bacterium]
MERYKRIKISAVPGLIQTLTGGFKIVSDHMELIILPVLFDLLIWLGPRTTIYHLFNVQLKQLFARMLYSTPITLYTQVDAFSKAFDQLLKGYNLTSSVSMFPLSVPILLNGMQIEASTENTKLLLPTIRTIELSSISSAFLISLALAVVGFLFGLVYYLAIAQRFSPHPARITFDSLVRRIFNVIVFLILVAFAMMALMIPVSCISSVAVMLSPLMSQIVIFLLLFSLAWLIVPFFFVFHGLFYGQSIRNAVKLSFNIGSWFSSMISFFIVQVIVISQGLKLIWTIPQTNSWLMLIGILGNAYIVTSLIGASFLLYWNYQKWIIANEELLTKGPTQI